jgi:hypothetical protein
MFRRVFLAVAALLALGFSPAGAQGRYARDPYGPGVVPLERILPQIRHGYPGTFYDAEGPYPDEMGNPHYHIKWLTPQGRVIWLDTDARTGRVMSVQGSNWRGQYRPPVYVAPYGGGPYGRGRVALPPPNWNRGNFGPRGGNWNGGRGGHVRGH